jgi:hypothetical protein
MAHSVVSFSQKWFLYGVRSFITAFDLLYMECGHLLPVFPKISFPFSPNFSGVASQAR